MTASLQFRSICFARVTRHLQFFGSIMSMRNQTSIKDDPEAFGEEVHDQSSELSPRKRNTTAIYSDALRYLIIEAIAKRPSLWDTKSREPLSLVQRKRSFAEIAEALSTSDVPLQAADIEKQWKNLKDTYYKVKKKSMEQAANNPSEVIIAPKWRFYSALLFIDQIEENHETSPKNEPPLVAEEETQRTRKRKSTPAAAKNTEIRESRKVLKQSFDAPEIISMKLKRDSPPKIPVHNAESLNYVLDEEDDYSSFCRYLNGKFREIGSASRTEFLRVQKQINDIIFDSQIKLSETNGDRHHPNGSH